MKLIKSSNFNIPAVEANAIPVVKDGYSKRALNRNNTLCDQAITRS